MFINDILTNLKNFDEEYQKLYRDGDKASNKYLCKVFDQLKSNYSQNNPFRGFYETHLEDIEKKIKEELTFEERKEYVKGYNDCYKECINIINNIERHMLSFIEYQKPTYITFSKMPSKCS